jgi:membrane-bound metal-dependent hydrolase YbcI (DUF457 family)
MRFSPFLTLLLLLRHIIADYKTAQSFSLFLPTIIRGLGYQNTVAQLFTVPPNMAAFFVVLGASFLSDRVRARGPVMFVGCLVAIGGYIMLLAAKKESVRYGGTFLVAVGVFPNSAMIMVSEQLSSPFHPAVNQYR